MVQRTKYDIEKIEQLLRKFSHLSNKEKWEEIGSFYNKSSSATHRWYYRQLAKQKNNKEEEQEKEINLNIKTDTIRTVYLLLLGKGCRIGYYQAIDEIKALLDKL